MNAEATYNRSSSDPLKSPAAARGDSRALQNKKIESAPKHAAKTEISVPQRQTMRMPTTPFVQQKSVSPVKSSETLPKPMPASLEKKKDETAIVKKSTTPKTEGVPLPSLKPVTSVAPVSGGASSVSGASLDSAQGPDKNDKTPVPDSKEASVSSSVSGSGNSAAVNNTSSSSRSNVPAPSASKDSEKESVTGVLEASTSTVTDPQSPAGPVAEKPKALGPTGVGQYLSAKGAPKVQESIVKLQKLKRNEQTHQDAATKLNHTEQAVVTPVSEGQSKSNSNQVSAVSSRPAPKVDEQKAKQQLQQSLSANIPQTMDALDKFKSDSKAQQISGDVLGVVQEDKSNVVSTFEEIGQTPAPASPDHMPQELPPEEVAPQTAQMDLGQGTVAPLLPEHTDLSSYTTEADCKLQEEGITQEQLDMVDKGELAEANTHKKSMEASAQTEPVALKDYAAQEAEKLNTDLTQEEAKERESLQSKRKGALAGTAKKQTDTKTALEKKREEVATKINGIYTTAQQNVKKKLSDLDVQSMKRFDDGNTAASKEFEDTVTREFDAFKAVRYEGISGTWQRVEDWFTDLDKLPEVKAIFTRNRTKFVDTIDRLVAEITSENKRVIQECKDELEAAKKTIKEYVDTLGPELQDVGKKAAGEMNDKLNELDQFVTQKEEELQNKLKDKQEAAIKAIDEKIEKMKEAMAGALSKFGKLLLQAAKKFFAWALTTVGYSLADIEGILNKGASVLKAIFTQPLQFVKNLMNAAITGFKNFGTNFLKHLKNALFEWLTGSLDGLVLPEKWDFPGIISVALQMIGISYQNIRKHMVTVMGEKVVTSLEETFDLVKTLVTKGPMAAWEQLKEMAADMRDAFIEAVKDFIKTKIIEQAIQWLLGIFIPGAGIVKAIIGIYDTVVFFIQKAKQIMQMINSFLGSIGAIAAGNIGAAADALEGGLARGLTLVINFLAQLLHLDGITEKIRNAIASIKAKVDAVLLKVAKWIAEKAKALWGKAKDAASNVVDWWKKKRSFQTKTGETHELSYEGDEKNPIPMVASNKEALTAKLEKFSKQASSATASEKEKGGKAAIEKVKSSAKKDPNYPSLLSDLGELLDTYDAGEGKETKVTRTTGSLGGSKVGLEMTIDWLGSSQKPGTKPESGAQETLMSKLTTDPNEKSPDKYIRGHLLNEHLGGLGNEDNMFPITGKANSQHLHSTETRVKNWQSQPKFWTWYQVNVRSVSSKLDGGPKSKENFINSTFECHAIKKEADGKVVEEFTTSVPSVYQAKDEEDKLATRNDVK